MATDTHVTIYKAIIMFNRINKNETLGWQRTNTKFNSRNNVKNQQKWQKDRRRERKSVKEKKANNNNTRKWWMENVKSSFINFFYSRYAK